MTRMDFGHRGEEASDTRAMAEADRVEPGGGGPRGYVVILVAVIVVAVVVYLVR
ncbi:MAG: hypothetical protein R2939_01300 [Kofleriaceae bacterium]